MSIYTDCRAAAFLLLDEPDRRKATKVSAPIFTEVDVILLAAEEACAHLNEDEKDAWMDRAHRECSNAMGGLWREGAVARFGPVVVNAQYEPDYVRLESKIVYAEPGRLSAIETPNGTFPAITFEHDPTPPRQGRRPGANRTDFEPWAEQPHLLRDPGEDTSPEQREIRRLKLRVEALERQLEASLEQEHRMRQAAAGMISPEEHERIIASLRDSMTQ